MRQLFVAILGVLLTAFPAAACEDCQIIATGSSQTGSLIRTASTVQVGTAYPEGW